MQAEEHKQAEGYFDRSGELFDSLYSFEKQSAFMRTINKLFRRDIYQRYLLTIEHVKAVKAASVLDVGIGGARYASGYLAAGVKRVVGIDISKTMLKFAEDHLKELPGADSVFELVHADIDEYGTEEKFDVVVAMGFFDYIVKPVNSLKKLREISNTSVIASFPSISVYRTPIRKIRYKMKQCPVFFFKRSDIEQLSRDAGFARCEITKVKGSGMDYVATFYR